MYVFNTDHLALGAGGSLGMIASPVPSFPQWPTVLCVELRLYGLFPVHSDMFVGISLVLLTFGKSCW